MKNRPHRPYKPNAFPFGFALFSPVPPRHVSSGIFKPALSAVSILQSRVPEDKCRSITGNDPVVSQMPFEGLAFGDDVALAALFDFSGICCFSPDD
ncbi:hypothetical protein GWI33_007672 [Rhynchophorus ferrugineus]|uniref:Uncharacterized protein n=1 Tax=Rhynchophorus ferrugineus TaxID=354439 RepID=A0A834ID36_RHYFE|nr:hypothetical protein GWI33_007672 [Rhynchophorus ferrugineus]